MSYLSVLRADIAALLLADPRFAGAALMSAWAQNVDTDALPVLAVGLPGVGIRRRTKDVVQRDARLVVIVKRAGGDVLETDMEADADAIERAVIGFLHGADGVFDAQIDGVDFTYSGAGETRIGTVTARLTAVRMTDEGEPDQVQ